MKANEIKIENFHDFYPDKNNLMNEVKDGLGKENKEMPCKLFYDKRGSQLFDQICELDEYYVTRTEKSIMDENIGEIVDYLGKNCLLIEFGSGSCEKIKQLLDAIQDVSGYVPIEISKEHLKEASLELIKLYPNLDVYPICADYHDPVVLPEIKKSFDKKLIFFPGSTIGNFHPDEAVDFLKHFAEITGDNGAILIGVDLKKDSDVLNKAYNDSKGITADFNLNLLHNLNKQLNANIDVSAFRHNAFYNEAEGRIEMHLISEANQKIRVDGEEFDFDKGESVWTESSYKYSIEEFSELAKKAGFNVKKVWTDKKNYFSVQYLEKI